MATPIDIGGVAGLLAARARPGSVLLVGITGSVAVGKSTLAAALRDALAPTHRVDGFGTDGFLLSNAVLAERGLTLRKGFPESFDAPALTATLAALRHGPARVPGYSHMTYDTDPELARDIGPADIILVEGLGMVPHGGGDLRHDLDLLIYLDADEADLERWFIRRFMTFSHAAAEDPRSFYTRFRKLAGPDAEAFARSVWTGINLPNLRDHIVAAQANADIVLRKAADHGLHLVATTPPLT